MTILSPNPCVCKGTINEPNIGRSFGFYEYSIPHTIPHWHDEKQAIFIIRGAILKVTIKSADKKVLDTHLDNNYFPKSDWEGR